MLSNHSFFLTSYTFFLINLSYKILGYFAFPILIDNLKTYSGFPWYHSFLSFRLKLSHVVNEGKFLICVNFHNLQCTSHERATICVGSNPRVSQFSEIAIIILRSVHSSCRLTVNIIRLLQLSMQFMSCLATKEY